MVPAFGDAETITSAISLLESTLAAGSVDFEIVVVADGDEALFRAAAGSTSARTRTVGYLPNRGKGFAVRYGLSVARGQLVAFIDSDMEISPACLVPMTRILTAGKADVVVGSKRHPSSELRYPPARRLQSAIFQTIVRMLFHLPVRDTQTGVKMMRRNVADKVVDVAVVNRFAFDVELLAIARRAGFGRIVEAPVVIDYKYSSTTNLRAVWQILGDLGAIFFRLHVLRTYNRAGSGMRALEGDLAQSQLLRD